MSSNLESILLSLLLPSKINFNQENLFENFSPTINYDKENFQWINSIHINNNYLNNLSKQYDNFNFNQINNKDKIKLLIELIKLIDLTTLSGDDTEINVKKLTLKGINPINKEIKNKIIKEIENSETNEFNNGDIDIHTAAICVYPARVKDVINVLNEQNVRNKIKVASVAAGFPSGQYLLKTRLHEIQLLCEDEQVDEIDIVIQRSLVLTSQWKQLYNEIIQMKQICGNDIHMKTILAIGELKSNENIYITSIIAILAGSDFIKTSTGKEKTNATISAGILMCYAIKDYYNKTGKKIGLKPAGGISTWEEGVKWLLLIYKLLGKEWLNKDLFRIGASSLLNNIIDELEKI